MNKIGSIIDFETIDSTSKYLKENYNNLKDFTFVSSLFQTEGRGRMERTWESKKGENLLFSLLIKQKSLLKLYSSISILSATVILNVLKDEYKIDDVSIKWPNDVYINSKKVSGILLEGISVSSSFECLIIGIGLNVNQKTFDNINATSMSLSLGYDIDIKKLKNIIYDKLMTELGMLEDGSSNYLDTARKNNYLKDKCVYANISGEVVLVKALDINNDNSIKIEYDNKTYNLFSDEITFHE